MAIGIWGYMPVQITGVLVDILDSIAVAKSGLMSTTVAVFQNQIIYCNSSLVVLYIYR